MPTPEVLAEHVAMMLATFVMEHPGTAVLLVDGVPQILYASAGVAALGWVEADLVGRPLHQLVGDVTVADTADHPAIAAQRASGTAIATHRDGSTLDVAVHSYLTRVEGFGPASLMLLSPSS